MLQGRMPLIIAVLLAGTAFTVHQFYLHQQKEQITAGWDLVEIVVANQPIAEGTVLEEDMVSKRPVPSQFVTNSNITPNMQVHIINQRVVAPLNPGDPLLLSHLESQKGFEKLSNMVARNSRAINISVDEIGSVGGWVRPNDFVDVLGTFRDPASREMMSITLLQQVQVLATGKITSTTNLSLLDENDMSYGTVTLMVDSDSAEAISLAADLGKLTLVLRNPEDTSTWFEEANAGKGRERTTIKTLITGEKIAALNKKLAKVRAVTVQSGTEVKRQVTGVQREQ